MKIYVMLPEQRQMSYRSENTVCTELFEGNMWPLNLKSCWRITTIYMGYITYILCHFVWRDALIIQIFKFLLMADGSIMNILGHSRTRTMPGAGKTNTRFTGEMELLDSSI